nr:tripartite motif-containing protein 16-like isoform X2 [Labrus bergylta]
MAQKGGQLHQELSSCSICLDLLKDPVTVPCGHSYCMNCIKSHWDKEDEKTIYSCPQCRQDFTPRPVLRKNTMLAVLVEELKKTGLQAAPADHCYAGPEDVACDVCTGRKLKACKSCLQCLASYCEKHLQPHYELPVFKKHKLVEPSKNVQENVCSRHDEEMKMFCRTDQQSICYLCSVDEHKGHDTVSAAAERTERQRGIKGSRQNIQQRIQESKKVKKLLQQEVEAINRSAKKTVGNSEKIFTELIRLMEKRRSDVKQQVRSQQQTEVSRVRELQEKLEQEITELKKKDTELEKLSSIKEDTQFLDKYSSLSRLTASTEFPDAKIRPLTYFEDVTAAEFLKYASPLTLDPCTAHPWIILSNGNRKITTEEFRKPLFCQPLTRFIPTFQILSRESLTGRSYWEVEWDALVSIAVAYKNISRSGSYDDCAFGRNEKSWSLDCVLSSQCDFRHNNVTTPIPGKTSYKVGVFLDHKAGILSFYNVNENMTLLHRVETTFTQPLYAGLGLHFSGGDNAELCELK